MNCFTSNIRVITVNNNSEDEFLIREYQNTDFTDLLDICKYIWEGEDYLLQRIDDYVNNPNSYPMVAIEEKKVVSVGNFEFLHDEIIWIEALRTHKNYRNKGWAQKLVNEMLIKAQSLGAKEAWLLSNTENLASQYVFSKLGFKEKTHLFMWPDWDTMDASLKKGNIVNIHLEKQKGNKIENQRIMSRVFTNSYDNLINSLNLSGNSKELSNMWKKCSSPEQVSIILEKIVAGGGLNILIGEFKIYPMKAFKIEALVNDSKMFYLNDPPAIAIIDDSGEIETGTGIGLNTNSNEALESLLFYVNKTWPTMVYWLFYPAKISHPKITPGFHIQRIMQKKLLD